MSFCGHRPEGSGIVRMSETQVKWPPAKYPRFDPLSPLILMRSPWGKGPRIEHEENTDGRTVHKGSGPGKAKARADSWSG
jgi:hypothetical protein